jgi:hypothetical protein
METSASFEARSAPSSYPNHGAQVLECHRSVSGAEQREGSEHDDENDGW